MEQTKNPSLSNSNLYKSGKSSKFFNTDKEQTNKFYKDTKVGSCSKIIVKNGVSIAVPFGIENEKGKQLLNYKSTELRSSETKSVYR